MTAALAWTITLLIAAGVLLAWADPVSGHALNAAFLAVAGLWLLSKGIAGELLWLPVPLLAVGAWGLVQLALYWTVYRYETWLAVTGWLAHAAILYLAYAALQERKLRDSVLQALLWCGALLSVVGMLQWFTANGRVFWLIPTPYSDEVMGTFLNRDHYCVFVELILPIALARALFGYGPRWSYGLASAFLYASAVGSGSRAGTALVSLEAVIMLGGALLRKRREYSLVLAVTAGMAVCSLATGWEYVLFRFQATDPLAFRREMAQATLKMIEAHPLTGFGLGAWPSAYPAFAVFDPPGFFMNHAHNDWLEWISDGGLPVLLAFLPLAWASVSLARRNLWALGVPVAFLHALVDFPLQKPALAGLAFFLLGAAAAASRPVKAIVVAGEVRDSRRRAHYMVVTQPDFETGPIPLS